MLGESYSRPAVTAAQKSKQAIELLMTGTETAGEAEAARKAKTLPLQGQFDPYKPIQDAELPTFMSRRGTEHNLQAPNVVVQPLTHLQAAKSLRNSMSDAWQPEHFQWLQKNYPNGIQEDELQSVEQQLRNPKPSLKVVGGNH